MKKTFIFTLLFAAFVLSACNQTRPSNKINVEMADFAFTPNSFVVPAGEQITIHITHNGLVAHEFIIMKNSTEVGAHFSEEDQPNIFWQIKIQPGETQTITFTAPDQPGLYQIVCGMPGHVEAGMIGKLTVVK